MLEDGVKCLPLLMNRGLNESEPKRQSARQTAASILLIILVIIPGEQINGEQQHQRNINTTSTSSSE
jgi:hypothetical protein